MARIIHFFMVIFVWFWQRRPRPPTADQRRSVASLNPIAATKRVTPLQWWNWFIFALAWTADGMDFTGLTVVAPQLAAHFKRSTHAVATAITLTLMFRALGALLFGFISDRFGRRWPLVLNLLIVAIVQFFSGWVNNFTIFLIVRSLFGIAMGGIWGMASAGIVENTPQEAHGVLCGLMQQGYSVGYLISAGVNLTLVPHFKSWRVIFYFGAAMSLIIGLLRAVTPESRTITNNEKKPKPDSDSESEGFWTRARRHFPLFFTLVMLMTGFNYFSHGSQDLYPTFAKVTKGMTTHQATVLTMIGSCGAIVGGAMGGGISQYIGRRITMIIFVLLAGLFIPLWVLPNGFKGLAVGAFFLQLGVQGSWGVVPIFLNELAPPAFRALYGGLSYQLGNFLASPAAWIEAYIGDRHHILVKGKEVPDYAFVQAILIAAVAGWILFWVLIVNERFGETHTETVPDADEENVPDTTDNGRNSMASDVTDRNDV